MDYMADIASVFHWEPDIMWSMSIDELLIWHQKAIDRNKIT